MVLVNLNNLLRRGKVEDCQGLLEFFFLQLFLDLVFHDSELGVDLS